MKNERGLAFLPVLAAILIVGSLVTGYLTVGPTKISAHPAVLKTGVPDYTVNQ